MLDKFNIPPLSNNVQMPVAGQLKIHLYVDVLSPHLQSAYPGLPS